MGERLVAVGPSAIPKLVPVLDEVRPCFIEGSEEATIGGMYGHRREDYAAIMIAKIAGVTAPELRAMKAADRDVGIKKVRAAL